MATHHAAFPSRTLQPLIRWAACTGIALLIVRRFVYALFPGFLPSNAWSVENWGAGLLFSAAFELTIVLLLVGAPTAIYFARRRLEYANPRDLVLDYAAVIGLYLTAFLFL